MGGREKGVASNKLINKSACRQQSNPWSQTGGLRAVSETMQEKQLDAMRGNCTGQGSSMAIIKRHRHKT